MSSDGAAEVSDVGHSLDVSRESSSQMESDTEDHDAVSDEASTGAVSPCTDTTSDEGGDTGSTSGDSGDATNEATEAGSGDSSESDDPTESESTTGTDDGPSIVGLERVWDLAIDVDKQIAFASFRPGTALESKVSAGYIPSDGTSEIRLWDSVTGSPDSRRLEIMGSSMRPAWRPDGATMAVSQGWGRSLYWDVEGDAVGRELPDCGLSKAPWLDWSEDGRHLVMAGNSSERGAEDSVNLCVVDIERMAIISSVAALGYTFAARYRPGSDELVVTVPYDEYLISDVSQIGIGVSAEHGDAHPSIRKGCRVPFSSGTHGSHLRWIPGERIVLDVEFSGSTNFERRHVKQCDWSADEPKHSPYSEELLDQMATTIEFSPNARWLGATTCDGNAVFVRHSTRVVEYIHPVHDFGESGAGGMFDWSPDGQYVVTGGRGRDVVGELAVWKVVYSSDR